MEKAKNTTTTVSTATASHHYYRHCHHQLLLLSISAIIFPEVRDLGFSAGKSKSLYSRDGHLGITLIKFPSEQSGLKEAMRLAEHFEKEHHGRRDWAHVKSAATERDEESNPNLVMLDQRTGERRRILYGYLATVSDLDKVDYETRKKVTIESKQDKLQPSK